MMTKADEVIEALVERCRHGFGSDGAFCVIHNVVPVSIYTGGKGGPWKWRCPVSGETMETKRERRRGRRAAANLKRRALAASR